MEKFTIMLCLFVIAYLWYATGKQASYSELLRNYKEVSEQLGRSNAIIEAYRIKYGTNDKENKDVKEEPSQGEGACTSPTSNEAEDR